MTQCIKKEQILDACFDPAQNEAINRHIENCEDCRRAVALWRGLRDEVLESSAQTITAPQLNELKKKLYDKVNGTTEQPTVSTNRFGLAIGVAAALVVGLGLGLFVLNGPDGQKTTDSIKIDSRVVGKHQKDVEPTWETGGGNPRLHTVGDDRIGLDLNSRASLIDHSDELTRIRLYRGTIACSVEKRQKGNRFTVVAGAVEVSVVGTAFSVSIQDGETVNVGVAEGIVRIEQDGKFRTTLRKGESWRSNRDEGSMNVPLEPSQLKLISTLLQKEFDITFPNPNRDESSDEISTAMPIQKNSRSNKKGAESGHTPSVTLKEIRTWIVKGKYEEAQSQLDKILMTEPKNGAAMSLLADCYRKQGKWEKSVGMYNKVETLGEPGRANRARLLAAAILQDRLGNFKDPLPLLEKRVQSGATDAETRVRLAKSLIAVGREAEGVAILKQVAATNKGSIWGDRAETILNKQ